MDPTNAAIEQVVREVLSQAGPDVPSWLKLVLSLIGVQVTAITGKLGFDFYQYRLKSPNVDNKRMIQTPGGDIQERRKWDAHRCDEHLTRIAGVEIALHKIEPELSKFEERFSSYIARLERGDSRFDGLTKAIEALNMNTAVLTKQVERLERTLDRNGGTK